MTELIGVDLMKTAATSGAASTGLYGAMNQEDSTPGGATVAFVAGVIGSGLVKPLMNYAAGLENTHYSFVSFESDDPDNRCGVWIWYDWLHE